ncbi:XAC2610-related protein [Metapseudomonas boanensis]|uniref:Uncharacterized protein n=1 Tax=Metapseudomonas boanensis TaxID=2822138 RepID=A0ABS5XIU3_9GAMM|nr:hypothetical protein [Pseudomonas boanensis]MBT8767228.1 hypothetical protein [Pseudomonas boanensis]
MKSKIAYSILLYLLSSLACSSEQKISETIFYRGFIARHPISMKLTFIENQVKGRYIYNKYENPINLSGKYRTKKLELSEAEGVSFILNENNGWFSGVWSDGTSSHKANLAPSSKPLRETIRSISVAADEVEIIFTEGMSQKISISSAEGLPKLEFEDFNFDGYPDMRILAVSGIPNSSYINYEYDPIKKAFISSRNEIKEINNPRVMHLRRTIMGFSKGGCCDYKYILISNDIHTVAEYDYIKESGYIENTFPKAASPQRKTISRSEFEYYVELYNSRLP